MHAMPSELTVNVLRFAFNTLAVLINNLHLHDNSTTTESLSLQYSLVLF